MILYTAALSLALVAAPEAQTAPTAEPVKERKICKREEAAIGSRLSRGRQICRTAAEWASDRQDRKIEIEDTKRDR